MDGAFTTVQQDWMRAAMQVAWGSDGAKIGSVIIGGDGRLLATGQSTVRPACDPTAHAEVCAIRAACQNLGSTDLTGCPLYSTLEPCGMCLSSCAWASLSEVIFGADYTHTPDIYYEQAGYSALEHARVMITNTHRTPLTVRGGLMAEQCAALLPAREGCPAPRVRIQLWLGQDQ